ncbi:PGAP1-like alpha/beta domain-containing protein [Dictyobacter kobayashii]|uniref:GPI inositol-deacylase PGAP1-like alpha/beta domain-containing protein n=1 Tax=Dictyobacter kobayashii TaxID=2014872 RepID=A0A402AR75_9CHLR|nr:hypothetical protein [Dictyobacter kobayashii]GCE21573.1 hypothetical protein KDK_53730 [Dictyobacter kobayashii]
MRRLKTLHVGPVLFRVLFLLVVLICIFSVLWAPTSSSAPAFAQTPLVQTSTPTGQKPHASTVGPRHVQFKEKAFPLAPRASYTGTSVVFVHGLNGGDGLFGTASNGSETMPDCEGYWQDAAGFLASRWMGDLRQISYYNREVKADGSDCASNGNEQNSISHYSADLHDALYRAHCASLGNTYDGTNNESIDHLSCLFAWYLFYNFGQRNWSEILIGHSMGGLIIRHTMELVEEHAPWMPTTIGTVTDAITFNTPHNGVFGAALACANCTQGREMNWGSSFMRDLSAHAQHPNSGNTDWTVVGSHCDGLVGNSSLMMDANHKVWYDNSSNPACYNHGGAIHDPSTVLNAQASYCDTTKPYSNDCVYDDGQGQGPGWYYEDTSYPHGLQEMYYALESYAW